MKFADTKWYHGRLGSNAPGFPHFGFVLSLVIAGCISGYILVIGYHARSYLQTFIAARRPKFRIKPPFPDNIWAYVNEPINNGWAIVRVTDGPIYSGWIRRYSWNPDSENQEFLLSDAVCVDEQLKEKYTIDGIGVYLNTRDVKCIEFIKAEDIKSQDQISSEATTEPTLQSTLPSTATTADPQVPQSLPSSVLPSSEDLPDHRGIEDDGGGEVQDGKASIEVPHPPLPDCTP